MKVSTNVSGPKPKNRSSRGNTRFASKTLETNASASDLAKSKGHFDSGAAPRVGTSGHAPVATQGGVPKGGTKKQLKISIKNVKKSSASPQAKKAARKLY